MSVRVPTDVFGRSINLPQLPFTTIEPPHSGAEYNKVFINVEGDNMEGKLNMSKNKLTNLPTPKDKLDAANKQYVDNVRSRITEALSKDFSSKTKEIETKIKYNRDQDLALKALIKKLNTRLESDNLVKQIRSTTANTKNISTLIIPWDMGYTITKNVILLQMLIQSNNNCCLDIQSLGYQYGLHVFERFNKTTKNTSCTSQQHRHFLKLGKEIL